MATITNAQLVIAHDHRKKTAAVKVTATVNFTPPELCLMKNCREARLFKIKCQLWGADGGLTGGDDFLYTFPAVKYFPDATPNASEAVQFQDTLGEGVLDEDWGEDEVYGRLILVNLLSLVSVTKKTNTVAHHF